MTGYGIAYDFIWRPGDYDIWALWLASEYVLATRDTGVLDEPLAYYPPDASDGRRPCGTTWCWRTAISSTSSGLGQRGLLHARNADWNDGLVFEAAPKDIAGFVRDGESTLASAFAAWVLPRFASVARGCAAIRRWRMRSTRSRRGSATGCKTYWTGQWLARAILPDGDRVRHRPAPPGAAAVGDPRRRDG